VRIALVYDLVHPYTVGGAERRFYELGRRLARRHDVTFVGLRHWPGPAVLETAEGLRLYGVPPPPGPLYTADGRRTAIEPLWFGAQLLRVSRCFAADVVDCSSFPYFSVLSSWLQARRRRAAFVVTWHEVMGDYWHRYAPGLAVAGRLVERLALRASTRAIAVSPHTHARLLAAGLAPERTALIPNGVDLRAIDAARRAGGPAPDVMFVGRLIQEKGPALLLHALAEEPLRARGTSCWIVGQGPLAGALAGLARELALADRVRFVPWLPEPELYAALAGAGAFVLPSEREGFGMVVLEALACGAPVVVTRGANSAAPGLVGEAEAGFVVDPTPGALAAGIASFLGASSAVRSGLSARARAYAARFDWDLLADRVERQYEDALAATRAR